MPLRSVSFRAVVSSCVASRVRRIGRARYEPGWRWSRDVGAAAGTALCELDHVGVVVAGRAAVRMAGGEEFIISAGDAFAIPAGHDSWVLGDEPYESIHLLGADDYAAS